MTSLAVRNDVKAQWATLVPALPLIEANNVSPKNEDVELPAEWARIGFGSASEQRMSIGSTPACWRETGIVVMRVYVKSGTGEQRVFTLVETLKSAWENYRGLGGYLSFLEISPPQELADGESDGDWYGVQVEITYTYETFK